MDEGGGKKAPSLKPVKGTLQWWNMAQLSKKYMNDVTQNLSSADISIISSEISKFY